MTLWLSYLGAIILANLLTARFGPWMSLICAMVFIGLDFTMRDHLHERWVGPHLWPKMAGLIVAGGALSWLINGQAGPIAQASVAAFMLSSLADALVYHRLRAKGRLVAINGSNLVGAMVDSVLFPTLAFGLFLPWIVLGQFGLKVLGGAVWAYILSHRTVGR